MKFKKGDRVICVHDTHDLKVGDVLFVEVPNTFCCNGIKFKEKEYHYDQECFELHIENEDAVLMIRKKFLIENINSFSKSIFFNQKAGVVSIDIIVGNIRHLVKELGIEDEFYKL
jgi:hypothetical protein